MRWLLGIDGPIEIPIYGSAEPEGDPEVIGFVEGYHLNAPANLLEEHPEIGAFAITPKRLRRVYAGDNCEAPIETVALWFADEAAAKAGMPAGSWEE